MLEIIGLIFLGVIFEIGAIADPLMFNKNVDQCISGAALVVALATSAILREIRKGRG